MTDQTPSTELVRQQSPAYSRASLTERQAYVRMLATAGDLLPDHLKGGMVRDEATNQMKRLGDAGKAFLLAETGDMLGIHPIAAVTGVHIIEGKPSISANLMGGLVRKVGHKLRVKTEGSFADGTLRVTATLVRADDPDYPFVVVWDIDKAKRAELLPGKPKSNWQKYPDAMMKARAISEVIREGAPDVLMGGNVYTAEELGAEVDEQGEPINLEQVRDDAPQTAPPAAAPAAPRPETPIPDEPAAEATVDVDWVKEMELAASTEDVRELYRRAGRDGLLATMIQWGDATAPLGHLLEQLGRAMAASEANEAAREQEAAAAAGADDPDVQDADVVDETDPSVGGPASDEAADAAQAG